MSTNYDNILKFNKDGTCTLERRGMEPMDFKNYEEYLTWGMDNGLLPTSAPIVQRPVGDVPTYRHPEDKDNALIPH